MTAPQEAGPLIRARAQNIGHGALSWLEAGQGDALVLLHGVGSAARSFVAQIGDLSARWRTLAWNAPGYGESAAFANEAPEAANYADSLAKWLRALDIGRCHLVGHSLGSLIAARFAAQYPERVRTLTLASCAIGHARLPTAERERLLASRIEDVATLGARGMAEKRGPRLLGPDASPEAIRCVVEVMASIHPHGYAQAARMLSRGDMLSDLGGLPLSMPVQVVYGTADIVTPPAVNQRAAQARSGIRVVTIERAGHALYVERPTQFNSVLQNFFDTAQ